MRLFFIGKKHASRGKLVSSSKGLVVIKCLVYFKMVTGPPDLIFLVPECVNSPVAEC